MLYGCACRRAVWDGHPTATRGGRAGAGSTRRGPARPRAGLPRRVPPRRRRRGAGPGVARRGRGRGAGGLPVLRPLLGAGRPGGGLAVRRRGAHRVEPPALRPPPRRPRGGGARRPGRAGRRGRDRGPGRTPPVRAALARLPRTQAVALVLRHSGLSYAEVAAALDLSPGSVGTTVRRAETALRKELSRHAPSR
ncbi:MAG TPA: sigma factor-like helix-turn-helix DNA-binding protein [Mycobacteriales bacterium]